VKTLRLTVPDIFADPAMRVAVSKKEELQAMTRSTTHAKID
jgi:hypothetical protein